MLFLAPHYDCLVCNVECLIGELFNCLIGELFNCLIILCVMFSIESSSGGWGVCWGLTALCRSSRW